MNNIMVIDYSTDDHHTVGFIAIPAEDFIQNRIYYIVFNDVLLHWICDERHMKRVTFEYDTKKEFPTLRGFIPVESCKTLYKIQNKEIEMDK